MADEYQRRATFFQGQHRLQERAVARVVQAGIRFVEHHETGIAVDGPRQPDALTLAAGEEAAPVANLRIVTLRKTQDHVMHARLLAGVDH